MEPEWGFPEGPTDAREKPILQCAEREFLEETNIPSAGVHSVVRIIKFVETFTGTNNVMYRHIYFVALTERFKASST
jgi:8-oxo-dGTP pyrophosphatase MutT (NUDIX family)